MNRTAFRVMVVVGTAQALGLGCARNDLVGEEGLVVTPPALDFGDVAVGNQLAKSLTVSNQGSASLNLVSAKVALGDGGGAASVFAPVQFAATALAPGASVPLSIAFLPIAVGAQQATLFLATDSSTQPTSVTLTGTGVAMSTAPVDAGPDAGPAKDAGPSQNPAGCADGTRDGFVDVQQYPSIAACSGAWSVPGVTGRYNPNGGAPGPVVPTCNLQGGNDGSNASGQGCSAADLCAAGWHICLGYQEVMTDTNGSGCTDAVPANFPYYGSAGNPSPGVLFALAQHECTGFICDDATDSCSQGPGMDYNDNDVHGCGNLGNYPLSSSHSCGPLQAVLGSESSGNCAWNQASPPGGPWQCTLSNSWNEGDTITKDGCQGESCSQYGYNSIGPSDLGGVLCCQG